MRCSLFNHKIYVILNMYAELQSMKLTVIYAFSFGFWLHLMLEAFNFINYE